MKKYLTIITVLLCIISAYAQDEKPFDFECNGIQYKILSEDERTVETSGLNDEEFTDINGLPKEDVILPQILQHDGKEYTLVKIGYMAFANSKAKHVTVPTTVREISNGAFHDASLEKINGIDSVRDIRGHTFVGSNIREFIFPDSIKTMGMHMFMLCHHLGRLELPKCLGNEHIGTYMFVNINPYEIKCNAVIPPLDVIFGFNEFEKEDNIPKNTWIVVPAKSVELYRKDSEWGRWGDKILPDNYALDTPVLFESDGLFFSKIADSDNFVSIVRPPKQFLEYPYGYGVGGTFEVPSKVTFQGKEYTVHAIGGFMDSEYEEIILPPTVKVIDRLAFIHSKLRRINTEHVTEIRHQAFHGSNIEEIKLSDGIQISADGAFYDCRSLVKVDLPSTISLFGDGNLYALRSKLFAQCINLRDLICRSKEPFASLAYNGYDPIFSGINNNGDIYIHISPTVWVPKGAIDAYREAWGKYTDDFRELEEEQVSITEVNADEAISVTVSGGTARISGGEGAAVTITSVSGRSIYSTANAPEEITIPLPRGIYLLTVNGKVAKFSV